MCISNTYKYTQQFFECQIHQETLTRYKQKEKDYLKNIDDLTPSDYCLYLTLKRVILYENEWIEWCDEALEYFSSLELDS
ncbi:MAG: hypothetical protein AB4057_23385 [Crocosphaera sp.]